MRPMMTSPLKGRNTTRRNSAVGQKQNPETLVSPSPFTLPSIACHQRKMRRQHTVDVRSSGAMADEALGGPGEVVETNAEANLLNDLVGILGINVVLDGLDTLLVEVLWGDLDQICDFGL